MRLIKNQSRYTLVSLLEPVDEGYTFLKGNWPPHITIAGPLITELNQNQLTKIMTELANHRHGFNATIIQEGYLGTLNNPVPEILVDMDSGLRKLHADTVDALIAKGSMFTESSRTGENYVAHINRVRKNLHLHEGDYIEINNLTLIDMSDIDGSQRKIIKVLKFPK